MTQENIWGMKGKFYQKSRKTSTSFWVPWGKMKKTWSSRGEASLGRKRGIHPAHPIERKSGSRCSGPSTKGQEDKVGKQHGTQPPHRHWIQPSLAAFPIVCAQRCSGQREVQWDGVFAHLPCSTSQCSPNKNAHIDSSVCLVVRATPHWSNSETGSVQITAHRAHPTDLQIITPSSSTTRRRGRDPFAKHYCNIQLFQNHRHTSYFLI